MAGDAPTTVSQPAMLEVPFTELARPVRRVLGLGDTPRGRRIVMAITRRSYFDPLSQVFSTLEMSLGSSFDTDKV
jgi:hypothetical protein